MCFVELGDFFVLHATHNAQGGFFSLLRLSVSLKKECILNNY